MCKKNLVWVALFTRAWIEITSALCFYRPLQRRPFHEGVDWNCVGVGCVLVHICRPFHEGVDWNFVLGESHFIWVVALFTRAWIEIVYRWVYKQWLYVALFTRAWIEMKKRTERFCVRKSSPFSRGRGLKYRFATAGETAVESPFSRGRGLKCLMINSLRKQS